MCLQQLGNSVVRFFSLLQHLQLLSHFAIPGALRQASFPRDLLFEAAIHYGDSAQENCQGDRATHGRTVSTIHALCILPWSRASAAQF